MQTDSPDQLLEIATQLHRAGDLTEARRLYRQALSADPTQVIASFRLGLLELQEGQPLAALSLIEHAAATLPGEFRYQFGLGEVFTALARWSQAAGVYRRAIQIDPTSADAHFGLGVALQSSGEFPDAMAAYKKTLDLKPDFTAAACNLGAILCRQHQFNQAVDLLRNSLELDPDNAKAIYNLAVALQGIGHLREAAVQYQKAIDLQLPNLTDAFNNLGNIRKELGEFKLAAAAYEAAIAAQPDSIAAINNLGCLQRTLGQLHEAEITLGRGLFINPDHPALHDNLGNVLKDSGRLGEAISCFRRALAIDPTNWATHSNLAYTLSFASTEPGPILEECRRWNTLHAEPFRSAIQNHSNNRTANRRLRIGYVSADFRDHCQSLFTIPLLSNHDHEAFEIICYSSVERPDHFTDQIAGDADVWKEVRHLTDAQLAEMIRNDRIDILVDLTMHMAHGRPLLFARKPAPIQIAWLAYPGSTGIFAMDYRLTDPRLDPPGFESHYTEQSIHLPDSFWCYDPLTDQPPVNDLPALSNGHLTLGCLNNPCKLTDQTFKLWANVMKALPTAQLLLMAPAGSHRRHLKNRLAVFDIAANRINFVPYRPRAEYLRTYHQIDLGLDTFPYNGHTTSLDSFWMGVPVISRIGQTSVGRGGLSQLHLLGLTELAAETDQAFVDIAVKLAGNLPRLAELRGQLRNRLQQSPLMDAGRFARQIESVYRKVWGTYCRE